MLVQRSKRRLSRHARRPARDHRARYPLHACVILLFDGVGKLGLGGASFLHAEPLDPLLDPGERRVRRLQLAQRRCAGCRVGGVAIPQRKSSQHRQEFRRGQLPSKATRPLPVAKPSGRKRQTAPNVAIRQRLGGQLRLEIHGGRVVGQPVDEQVEEGTRRFGGAPARRQRFRESGPRPIVVPRFQRGLSTSQRVPGNARR